MRTPFRHDSTGRRAGSEAFYATIVIVGMLIGFSFATRYSWASVSSAVDTVRNAVAPQARARTPNDDRVLIVTANLQKELNTILTLSPRGLEPLLARSPKDVRTILPRYGSHIRLVVIDENFPNADAIARSLGKSLSRNRIIVLKGSSQPEEIGALLLEKL